MIPQLHTEPNVTAVAGQVLELNGQPLAGVTLRIEDQTARTNGTGLFQLESVPPGHHKLLIDGRTAGGYDRTYGEFEVGVDVIEGQTNLLPFAIWMPEIDMANAVTIPSPTTEEAVVTTPDIPGLELRILPGSLIRDIDGEVVTQVSITPVPLDRPPFPMPTMEGFPVYFTIQPGGAYIYTGGARIIYPNYTNQRSGTRIDFWLHDPEERGWYLYGQGTVTPDREKAILDPGVEVYKFTGMSFTDPTRNPPDEGPGAC